MRACGIGTVGVLTPYSTQINGQIEAFQRDDFNAAFSYASPGIQGIFGTAERCGQMVRNGYPTVWPALWLQLQLGRG